MSGPFKDRLVSALHESVGYFNQDNDPNAAVAKAAASNDFNIDQTRRLVEMFNTARTLYHYKSASDRTPCGFGPGTDSPGATGGSG